MKTIVLSFDDARSDFYSRAYPILKKFKLPSTLNVITNFIRGNEQQTPISFPSARIGVSKDNLLECYESGLVEIACHGANHLNTREDVLDNIEALRAMGINEPVFGFASPNSVINEKNKNEEGVWDLVNERKLKYIRSGIQIRREGYVYILESLVDSKIHSNYLFKRLNRNNIIKKIDMPFLPSVAIYSYTTVKQIMNLIASNDNSAIILMFHSILKKRR